MVSEATVWVYMDTEEERRAMRIALITTLSTYYRRPLFEELARRWDVDFMFFSDGNEWYRSAEVTHEVGRFNAIALHGHSLRGQVVVPDLPRTLARGRYDVVIKCLNGKLMVPYTFISTRALRIPLVLWTGMWDHPSTPLHRLSRPVLKGLYKRSDAVVAYGEHVKTYLTREMGLPGPKVFVAGQAVEGSRFERVPRIEAATPPVALYIGQLEERKGISYLVDAFRSLPAGDIRLRVVGSGSLSTWVDEQARVDPRIEAVGYRPQSHLPDELSRARCLVLPSVHAPGGREPWGLVVNEAMHAGRPVVATESVGAAAGGLVADGRNGYVVQERSAQALAPAISRLLSDADLARRLGGEGAMDVRRFSYAHMADAFGDACAYATAGRR
jgi:glycosyltransferase involved in cell wall biosynthesis